MSVRCQTLSWSKMNALIAILTALNAPEMLKTVQCAAQSLN